MKANVTIHDSQELSFGDNNILLVIKLRETCFTQQYHIFKGIYYKQL